MDAVPIVIEGTVEEIREQLGPFAGQRLHVTVLPLETSQDPVSLDPQRKLSIGERIAARFQAMPPEELAKMPVDLAEQHDHYIYGWPKK